MKKLIITILLILPLINTLEVHSNPDPILSGLIVKFTNVASKMYSSQIGVMGMMSGEYIVYKSNVERTTSLQKEFDNYLSSFEETIAYAAQIYGFYCETSKLCENIQKLNKQLGDTPENAVALSIYNKRNDIYLKLITKGTQLVNIIRKVCIDNKMTQAERIKLTLSIRPKFAEMNDLLSKLTKLIRTTKFAHVWHTINKESHYSKTSRSDVVDDCLSLWKINADVKMKK